MYCQEVVLLPFRSRTCKLPLSITRKPTQATLLTRPHLHRTAPTHPIYHHHHLTPRYLTSKYGRTASDKCFEDIQEVLLRTLEACQPVVVQDRCVCVWCREGVQVVGSRGSAELNPPPCRRRYSITPPYLQPLL